jgi:hypothetical protein
MADNVAITQGSGVTVASEDVSGVQHQKVKMEFGGDGVATLVSSSDPLPVVAGASTSNIGDVDVFSNTAKDGSGTRYQPIVDTDGHLQIDVLSGGGGGTQYTEGDIDASFTGTIALAEGPSNTATPLQVDASNHLQVDLAASSTSVTVADGGGSLTVDNNGTFVVQENGAALTALQLIDDTVVADDAAFTPATTKVVMSGYEYDDTTTDTLDEGDAGAARVDASRRQLMRIVGATDANRADVDASGHLQVDLAAASTSVTVSDGGGSLTVDNNNTFVVQENGAALTALQLIDDTVATTASAITTKGIAMSGTDGTNARVIKTDTSGELQVDVVGALPAGTNAIGKLAANSGVDIGDVDVLSIVPGTGATNLGKAEDAGHTTGDTGSYILGVRNDTPNTALTNTDADYASITTDRVGGVRTALYETDFAVLGTNHVKKYYTNAGAVTDGIVWSPAAGKRWYVTDIIVNTSAAATVTFEDDLAAGDAAVLKMELAANSGFAHHFGTPLFSGEDAADLLVTTSAGNIYITVTGYEV